MMQGCIIAYDAPPPSNILILFDNIFHASNDLRDAIFQNFLREARKLKSAVATEKRPWKEKWQNQAVNLDTVNLTRSLRENLLLRRILKKLQRAPLHDLSNHPLV